MTAFTDQLSAIRSALFLPASNARAIEKARGLDCDMAILDLEDAVKDADKDAARAAAAAAGQGAWRPPLYAVRINAVAHAGHAADLRALRSADRLDVVVVPKVESPEDVAAVTATLDRPVLAMIESPLGVLRARAIAGAPGVCGLIAGTNDLSAGLRLPPGTGRAGLSLVLQSIVLSARIGGGIVLDGVFNRLDDPEGLAMQCAEGRSLGFDGKTLIHPNQIATANEIFGPSDSDVEEAHALIAAHSGGAARFRDRMIEAMHVEEARRTIARAGNRATALL